MFISEAFASVEQTGVGTGSMAVTLVQLGAILLIFYLFMIRPQIKRMKAHEAMVNALKIGDEVVTTGGIHGKVVKLNGANISIEVAEGVNIVVERMNISAVIVSQAPKSETKENNTKTTAKKTKVKKQK